MDSIVVVIFGQRGKGQNTLGIRGGDEHSSQGSGVVVDKRTIRIAEHTYSEGVVKGATTMFVQADGIWGEYPMSDLIAVDGEGDQMVITLPMELPGDINPAAEAKDYHSETGQAVVATYVKPIKNTEGLITGFSIHLVETVTLDPLVEPEQNHGNQLRIKNPGKLNRGDSGAGVFYNNQLIGINSNIVDETTALVTPLCFLKQGRMDWLLGHWPIPC